MDTIADGDELMIHQVITAPSMLVASVSVPGFRLSRGLSEVNVFGCMLKTNPPNVGPDWDINISWSKPNEPNNMCKRILKPSL